MRLSQVAGALAILLVAACSEAELAEMEGDRFDKMNLSARQLKVAQAMVAGFKKEFGIPVLRSREYLRAGCYAKKVNVPLAFEDAHLSYLANYVEADRDYYGFFSRQGLSEQHAWAVSEAFHRAQAACGI
jgi:hypothetical protein